MRQGLASDYPRRRVSHHGAAPRSSRCAFVAVNRTPRWETPSRRPTVTRPCLQALCVALHMQTGPARSRRAPTTFNHPTRDVPACPRRALSDGSRPTTSSGTLTGNRLEDASQLTRWRPRMFLHRTRRRHRPAWRPTAKRAAHAVSERTRAYCHSKRSSYLPRS